MSNYTILLIDYEPRSIERLRAPLERAGYRVEVARDGESGIEQFHQLKPNAVIIEAMLPKRHGFEVCRELKNTAHGALCPVMIATSVYRGRKYRHQAIHQYHCDEYLEKPLADEDLLPIVETALQKYSERRRVAAAKAAGTAAKHEMEIDTSLLAVEPEIPTEVNPPSTPAPPTPMARTTSSPTPEKTPIQARPPKQPAIQPATDDNEFEFDIANRLDALLSDDPSKSSPSGSN